MKSDLGYIEHVNNAFDVVQSNLLERLIANVDTSVAITAFVRNKPSLSIANIVKNVSDQDVFLNHSKYVNTICPTKQRRFDLLNQTINSTYCL